MRAVFIAASLLFLFSTGCGGASTGTVSGKISYQGQLLNYGQVTFRAPTNDVMSGQIQQDGSYTVENIPVGPAQIAVNVPKPPSPPPPGVSSASTEPEFTGTPVVIPKSFATLETSGLTYEVTSGSQTHDIELK